jgi:flagellar biosynthesis protein FlhB
MASDRPFPPSARRRALARSAGLSAASPIVVGAAAWIGAVAAVLVVGRAIAVRLGVWIAEACSAGAGTDAVTGPRGPSMSAIVTDVLAFVLPVLIAAALAAVVAHVAQTRGVWMPRRKLRGAPALEESRAAHGGLAIAGAITIGAVTLAWLWAFAPRLALLIDHPDAAALMLAGFLGSLAAVWIVLGAIDALLRHAELQSSLRMTAADKREDERLAGADPRWRARRAEVARGAASVRDAVAGASVVLLADGAAVAVAWDPVRRPVPVRTVTGKDARATQILALARRHGIAVHRDPELALALVDGDGPVPEARWARLAEIIAATARRTSSI